MRSVGPDTGCHKEVLELHRFFQDWFAGVIPRDDGLDRLLEVLGDDFEIVSPDGKASSRGAIVASIEAAHGVHREQGVRISIENFRGRELGGGVSLASYEEWQRIGDTTRVRLSTAVFTNAADAPNGVQWRHVHETWMRE